MKFRVIWGPPCSGKSTYVRENIGDNDLVYDYDRIGTALSYVNEHNVSRGNLHDYIIDIRMLILKRAKNEKAIDNIYFITTNMSETFKNFIASMEPEYIRMDVSKEECLKRLEADDSRPDKESWKSKIEDWFDKYDQDLKEAKKRYYQIG